MQKGAPIALLLFCMGISAISLYITIVSSRLKNIWITRFKTIPVWAVWTLGFGFLIWVFGVANSLSDASRTPAEIIPFYLWSIAIFLNLIWVTRDRAIQLRQDMQQGLPVHERVLLALVFAGISFD